MGKARTSAKPVRLSATSNLHVPSLMPGKEKERDRRMGKGPRKWTEKRWARRGRQVVSHCLTLVSVPSLMSGMIREREKEKERKRGISNSSSRGTPQIICNCLLRCQPMAMAASSPLNIEHKHNVHTICYFSIRPHRQIWVCVGITTVTTTHRVIYTLL